jgi:MFS transporter, DHA2 family, multidrug resistance protein
MLLCVGLPLILVPITTSSYDDIPPDKTDQASALLSASTYPEKSRRPSLPNSRGARQPVSLSKIYYDIRPWLRAADEHISRPRFVERFGTIGDFPADQTAYTGVAHSNSA